MQSGMGEQINRTSQQLKADQEQLRALWAKHVSTLKVIQRAQEACFNSRVFLEQLSGLGSSAVERLSSPERGRDKS
jgi:hypothetical protein